MEHEEGPPIIKLIDFGLSKKIEPTKYDEELMTRLGTPQLMAPEILDDSRSKGYSRKCDMWAVGVILYVMFSGYYPFNGDSIVGLLQQI